MDGKINYGVYHEHVIDLYEFKQPEKLLSDLTDSSATDSESSNDERSFDDSFSDHSDTENETVDENNNLIIQLHYTISELWSKVNDEILVGTFGLKVIRFKPNSLKICETQSWIFVGEGISKINTKNIYDVSKKGDIILCINIL